MPLYEYCCADCAEAFEDLVPAGRADQVSCPTCGSADVRRLVSVFSTPRASGGEGAAMPSGGCCGGACGSC